MRPLAPIVVSLACLSFTLAPAAGQKTDPWAGVKRESRADRLEKPMDPLRAQGMIDTLNEESKERYGHTFIVKHYLDLGPLNRVQVNPDLWNGLTVTQRRQVGARFAKAFKGTGLLFAQFYVEDARVGKVRADPISGGLKFEMEE